MKQRRGRFVHESALNKFYPWTNRPPFFVMIKYFQHKIRKNTQIWLFNSMSNFYKIKLNSFLYFKHKNWRELFYCDLTIFENNGSTVWCKNFCSKWSKKMQTFIFCLPFCLDLHRKEQGELRFNRSDSTKSNESFFKTSIWFSFFFS